MKIALAGKGGVGKTTIAGTLARLLARDGFRVLAVDADPAMNLASAIGLDQAKLARLVPLSENHELIEERTGARPGSTGGVFSLTPKVHDIAEKFGVDGPDGVTLLVMGTVKFSGGGCMCPANSLLRALMRHLLLERGEVVIMDMEAGLEHLGRGTVRSVDALIDIVEPSTQSFKTALKIEELSRGLGLGNVMAVANKVKNLEEIRFLRERFSDAELEIVRTIPYDINVAKADVAGTAPVDYAPSSPAIKSIKEFSAYLEENFD